MTSDFSFPPLFSKFVKVHILCCFTVVLTLELYRFFHVSNYGLSVTSITFTRQNVCICLSLVY